VERSGGADGSDAAYDGRRTSEQARAASSVNDGRRRMSERAYGPQLDDGRRMAEQARAASSANDGRRRMSDQQDREPPESRQRNETFGDTVFA